MANFNIVKDYDWTEMPRGSPMRSKGPKVRVTSYKINSNQIMQMIKGYVNVAGGVTEGAEEFYENIYGKSADKEDDFCFPYFSDSVRSFSNTFGDTFQKGVGGGGGLGEGLNNALKEVAGVAGTLMNMSDMKSIGTATNQLGSAAKSALEGNKNAAMASLNSAAETIGKSGNPGTYIETPQFYQFEKNDAPADISFILYNTVNSDWKKNQELVDKLTRINRPLRKSSITVDPPRIYSVKIYGLRFIRWAVCSSFNVELLGTRRMVEEKIVPDAYRISMSFQSLTLEHAGFMDKV